MAWLSEEGRLLAENWETVEGILAAQRQLQDDLSRLLRSIEPELAAAPWWPDGWTFVRYRDSQVYISKRGWRKTEGSEHAVWIGVEGFEPAMVFGSSGFPTLYVWVPKAVQDLRTNVTAELRRRADIPDNLETGSSGYVVRRPLRTCLPEDIETYHDTVRQEIKGSFVAYQPVAKVVSYASRPSSAGREARIRHSQRACLPAQGRTETSTTGCYATRLAGMDEVIKGAVVGS